MRAVLGRSRARELLERVAPAGNAELREIFGVQQDHPPATLDPPVPVILSVDRGVELIVGADGHEEELPGLERAARDRMHQKVCAAGVGVELPLARRVGFWRGWRSRRHARDPVRYNRC